MGGRVPLSVIINMTIFFAFQVGRQVPGEGRSVPALPGAGVVRHRSGRAPLHHRLQLRNFLKDNHRTDRHRQEELRPQAGPDCQVSSNLLSSRFGRNRSL